MIDINEVHKWWDIFVGDGNFTEVRILGKFSYSGYFKSVDRLIEAISPYQDMDDEQFYFVMNRIDDACYGRQQSDKIVKSPKITTNDNDIVRRRWIMVDFDPVRKSGTNSSDEEFNLSLMKAKDVYYFLKERGFSEPVITNSGNGTHLQYQVDLPNDEETTNIIKGFFAYLGHQYSDEKVEVDLKNFNLARLCKLYGTTAKKGANLPERPWRDSKIVYIPKVLDTTPIEKFKELSDLVPKEEHKQQPNRSVYRGHGQGQPFDLEAWLNQYGIVYKVSKDGTTTRYTLEECPWIDSHSDRKKWDSALFQDIDGKITFNCQHSHCHGRTWQDFRLFYEPTAYDPKPQQYQIRIPARTMQAPPPPIIKPEIPELGKKWLSMSDITKVNIAELDHFKTGFTQLDRAIRGLFFFEVTIVSGTNSSGKSSWLNTLMINAVQQGHKVAMWSGELRSDVLKSWIQMVAAGKDMMRKANKGNYWFVPNDIAMKIDRWLDGKFFLYNNEYSNRWEQIFNDMQELLKLGVRIFILDNLFSLDIDIFAGDSNKNQKALIKQLTDFAKQNKVHIILVAHPRKVTTFIRKTDISGTSDITNAADNVFIIHRVNQDFMRTGKEFFGTLIDSYKDFGNVIEVAKNRLMGVQDMLCGMYYEIESRRFKNREDDRFVYGWRDDIAPQLDMFDDNDGLPFDKEDNSELPF